jgi:hypothetical protein
MSTATSEKTLLVQEPDYAYGTGLLRLRVERIDWADPVTYLGDTWHRVVGVEIGWNGSDLGRREVLIRGRRISESAA